MRGLKGGKLEIARLEAQLRRLDRERERIEAKNRNALARIRARQERIINGRAHSDEWERSQDMIKRIKASWE